jgi:hypothetical protein
MTGELKHVPIKWAFAFCEKYDQIWAVSLTKFLYNTGEFYYGRENCVF